MITVDDDPLGVFDTPSEVVMIESLPPSSSREHRKEPRYRATWKVSISVEGENTQDGKIKDISLHGVSILIGRNFKTGSKTTINLYLPSLTGPAAPKIAMVHGIVVYTIHDADKLCFRVGINFVKFEPASDRGYLNERLSNHHIKIA